MKPGSRLFGGICAAAIALALGVLAAWPIYESTWLWIVAGAGLVIGAGLAWARERWAIAWPVFAALILVLFVITLVPVAVPQALSTSPVQGLLDGTAAIALGWKQLLTLTLPVGTYQTVLIPAYVVYFGTALLTVFASQRARKWPVLAAVPMLAPVAFGTIFGASVVSPALQLGPVTVAAPRELGLWLAVSVLAALWIAWVASAERRAALRLGRNEGEQRVSRSSFARAISGAAILVVALIAGLLFAPMLDDGERTVARDKIDPELVVRDRPSPLASYRTSKRDAALDRPLFSVTSSGALPERLRLAVLDTYDGVDFHVSSDVSGRFTRFPSGERLAQPSTVTVTIADGYDDIWAPTAKLGSAPKFTGKRSAQLADAFYVNRETGAAIAVPRGGGSVVGLASGDGYSAVMETAPIDAALGDPASTAPLIDLKLMPELASWVERQGVAPGADGLATLIELLRDRGYLSHSMSEREGELLWVERLAAEYGASFETSAGGHSRARLESLFTQLNSQQIAAGENADAAQLVAGIGDDEQFAAAAALIAQALGYESRVVVGVRLAEGVPGVPACDITCTGANLAAWVEVRGAGGEWVTFDATPQVEMKPQRLEQGEQLPEFPSMPEERDAREVDPPIGMGDQGERSETSNEVVKDGWLLPALRIAALSLSALVLILLPLLFLPVAKRLRAKRRRVEPEPELRALGAWQELLDRAVDAGVDVSPGWSRRQVAAALGSPEAAWIASEVDRAVFSQGGLTADAADTLWKAVKSESEARAATLTRGERWRAVFSVRSYGIRIRRHSTQTQERPMESENA